MLAWRVFLFVVLVCKSEVGAHEEDVLERCSRTVFGNIPDPEDCSRYYVCTFDTALSRQCPNDEFFNSLKWSCAPSRTVVCTKREPLPETEFLITPETTSTTTTTTTTTTATTTTTGILQPTTQNVPNQPSAPEMYIPMEKTGVCNGRTVKIQCTAVGLPRPVIQWKRHGITLIDGPKYKIESSSEGRHAAHSTLLIRAVSNADYGFYSCRAHNELGLKSVLQEVYYKKYA